MNPFESDTESSEYFLDGESEEKSLKHIRKRIAKQEGAKISFPYIKVLSIAASLAFIVIVGYYIVKPDSSVNRDLIVNESFQHYPDFQNLTVRGITNPNALTNAYAAYDKMNYSEAIEHFEATQMSLSEIDKLYYGISLLGAKNYTKAESILSHLDELSEGEYKYAHSFYFGLSLLANNEVEPAISVFEILADGNSQFSDTATEILNAVVSDK